MPQEGRIIKDDSIERLPENFCQMIRINPRTAMKFFVKVNANITSLVGLSCFM